MTTFPVIGLHLDSGAHGDRNDGVCVMEAVAWYANELHSDAPKCVDKRLASVCIMANDSLDEIERQRFVPLIPRLAGTANDGREEWRKQRFDRWIKDVRDRLRRNDYESLVKAEYINPEDSAADREMALSATSIDSIETMIDLLNVGAVTADDLFDLIEELIKGEAA